MEEIIKFAEENGLIVSKESIDLLSKNKNWQKILKELSDEGQMFIEPKILESKLARTKISLAKSDKTVKKTDFEYIAKTRKPNFRVMSEYDVTGQSNSEGKVDDFLRLFRSKFELISKMLKERHNLSPITIF